MATNMKLSTPGQATLLRVATALLLSLILLSYIPIVSSTPTPTKIILPPIGVPSHNITKTLTSATITSTITSTKTTTKATPTTNFILPTSVPTTVTNSTFDYILTCPPPLIPNVNNLTSPACNGACCLPCPASAVFYAPNRLEHIYTTTSVIRVVSAVACAVLAGAYLLVPNQRKNPHLIVLVFVLLMVPLEGLGTIWLFKREDLLCYSAYEASTMENSWLCGLQGIVLVYLVLVMLCLGFLLIANLHFLALYNSYLIQSHMTKFITLSFILPLSLVVPIVIRKQIMNPGFGSICFVGPSMSESFFFIPMSVIACLAMLLHLTTIISMIKTKLEERCISHSLPNLTHGSDFLKECSVASSRRQRHMQTARDISMLLKQQWRPGVLALWLIIMDMVYWLFYFMDIKGLQSLDPNSQGFLDWVGCLAHQTKTAVNLGQVSLQAPTADQVNALSRASQQACAYVTAPWVPNFVWGAVADLLPATFGTVLLIIFGSRVQLWRDLRVRLFGKPNNIGNQDGGSKTPKTSTEKSLPPPPRPRHDIPPNYLESFFESQIEDLYSSPRNLSLVTSGDSAESGPTRFSQLIAWDRSPGAALAYRADTPEAWKPSPVPSSFALCLTASENDIANLTRINGTSTPQPNITSLRVPPQSQKRFYNTEDFEALPIFLVTPPPMYNPNNNRSQHHLATPTKDNDDCPEGDVHKAVVSEASRIQLNYRTNPGAPYQQPQVVHQTKPQRTESLPAPARPRNPARKESLHKSSPAPARTLNLARHDDSSTDPSNFSRNESLSRTNSPNYNQNLIRADSLGLNLSIPKRPTKNSARFK